MSSHTTELLTGLGLILGPVCIAMWKAIQAARTSKEAAEQIQVVHSVFNSRFDELMRLARKESFADGVKEGTEKRDKEIAAAMATAAALRGDVATEQKSVREEVRREMQAQQAAPAPVAATPTPLPVDPTPPAPKAEP